ncbi:MULTISPECIES: cytochrome c-type biogenesis protein [Methylomonas]|uniref:cytochrome c-type biogenesis protein n=1 Tax=Methylomonas TaxID=416 RepID=UPI0012322013|nr:cytochrome c-type biogenesis protein [Methylomonas rhizoryzae]
MKRLGLILVLVVSAAAAETKVFEFQDPLLEQRYQNLTEQLRCLVCQNQNIADSHAELAQDLRDKVYELLNKGQSDQEIIGYMTDRYGDFVLYRPPFKFKTLLLWLGPLLAVLLGLFAFWRVLRGGRQSVQDVKEHDLAEIRNLLDKE